MNNRLPLPTSSHLRIFCLLLCFFFVAAFTISCGRPSNSQHKYLSSTEGSLQSNNPSSRTASTSTTSSAPKYEGDGSAFVNTKALKKQYHKVAVMPFKAEVEIAGASVADMLTTEMLKTYKYDLVERSQIEQILQEQSLGMQGVTENAIAMKIGKILGVQGVIVGTVPEFGTRAVRGTDLPTVGINIRMIDTETGSIIWTVSDAATSKRAISTSTLADYLVKRMITNLKHEWIRAGDTLAVNLPSPQIVDYQGNIRQATIHVQPESKKKVKSYTLLRSRTKGGPYTRISTVNNRSKGIIFKDKKLLDDETYYYKVSAAHLSGLNGPPAGPIKITTKGAPGALTGIDAESGGLRECRISWEPSVDPEVAGYDILRAENQGGPFKKVAHVKKRGSAEYVDKDGGRKSKYGNLQDNFTYYYKIKSVNIVGIQSPDSQTVSATTEGLPPVIENLQAYSDMLRKVALTWEPSKDKYVVGYEILRSESQNGSFTPVTIVKGQDKNEYVDTGSGSSWGKAGKLEDKKTYYYKISALNYVDVRSPDSNIAKAVTRGKPPVITGVLAENGLPRKVHLLWQPSSDEFVDSYAIYRSVTPSGPFEEIKTLSGRDHSDYMDKGAGSSWGEVGKLLDNTTYYYQIRSINIVDVPSDESVTVSAVTKPMLDMVKGVNAVSNQVKQVSLSWSPLDCKEYEIFRGESSSSVEDSIATVGANSPQYTDKKLEDGKQYFYKIRAIDSYDLPGVFSQTVSASTKPLPQKVAGLSHSLNGGTLSLSWQQNPETDITVYKIMEKGFFSWEAIAETENTSYTFPDQLEPGTEFLYKVIAVDRDGLEGIPSDVTSGVIPE